MEFKELVPTKNKLFVFHGYPDLIYSILYDKTNDIKVLGYKEIGAITTPFDMRVRNKIDRYNICLSASKILNLDTSNLENYCNLMLKKHKNYIKKHGIDMMEHM